MLPAALLSATFAMTLREGGEGGGKRGGEGEEEGGRGRGRGGVVQDLTS